MFFFYLYPLPLNRKWEEKKQNFEAERTKKIKMQKYQPHIFFVLSQLSCFFYFIFSAYFFFFWTLVLAFVKRFYFIHYKKITLHSSQCQFFFEIFFAFCFASSNFFFISFLFTRLVFYLFSCLLCMCSVSYIL